MTTDYRNIKVLVIDDDQKILDLICNILKRREFDLYTASDGGQGMELFKKENPSIILKPRHTDHAMGEDRKNGEIPSRLPRRHRIGPSRR